MTGTSKGSARPGGAGNAVEAAVSRRARIATRSLSGDDRARWSAPAGPGPGEGLLDSLRHHLLAGETHYPDRPGMGELRRRVGAALPGVGLPAREPDGVLITQGEGESLFATLLGLGGGEGAVVVARAGGRHGRLLDWMGVRLVEPGAEAASGAAFHLIEHEAGAVITEDGASPGAPGIPRVHAIGDLLFADAYRARAAAPERATGPSADLADDIVIGSLDGLAGMRPFSLGFVAAPVEVRPRIAKWKQASSICSPAPSQRAALWALGVRP